MIAKRGRAIECIEVSITGWHPPKCIGLNLCLKNLLFKTFNIALHNLYFDNGLIKKAVFVNIIKRFSIVIDS